MAQAASKGNCYLCGETISKTAFKKHLMEKHNDAADDAQTCKLLKVEGTDEKAYTTSFPHFGHATPIFS